MDPGGGYGWRSGRAGGGNPYSLRRRAERATPFANRPLAVLLLPRELEAFSLRERAEDLLAGPGVVAVEPARMSYEASLRLPEVVADGLAAQQARRLRLPGVPRVIVLFHPLQYPLARGLVAQHPDAELWYARAADADAAHGGSPRRRERLERFHDLAEHRATLTLPAAAPAGPPGEPLRPPGAEAVAVAMGADAGWLGDVAARVPGLALLAPDGGPELVAAAIVVRPAGGDPAEAARLLLGAGAGLLAGAPADGPPRELVELARRGRRTIAASGAGLGAWERAATVIADPGAAASALREAAAAPPDEELRGWARARAMREANRELWERLEALGVESGRLGSERRDVMAGVRAR